MISVQGCAVWMRAQLISMKVSALPRTSRIRNLSHHLLAQSRVPIATLHPASARALNRIWDRPPAVGCYLPNQETPMFEHDDNITTTRSGRQIFWNGHLCEGNRLVPCEPE